MSIALDSSSSRNRMESSGFIHGLSCVPIFDVPDPGKSMAGFLRGERRFPSGPPAMPSLTKVEVEQQQQQQQQRRQRQPVQEEEQLDSCSSSIGKNSDLSGRSSDYEDSDDETEVQSCYKGPLDTLDALEEVLPIRRGISKLYNGKSKSFTSLADAASFSIKDLGKPENAYTRRRKNLLACSNFFDRNRSCYPLRSNGGGISKRPIHSSRSTLALAVAMNSFESNTNSENSNPNSSSSPPHLPPLHPQAYKPAATANNASSFSPPRSRPRPRRDLSSWRSFSLADLECAASNSSSISNRD